MKVVVWCRNQKIYNAFVTVQYEAPLWFGVGIKRYTTTSEQHATMSWLWFGVGIKRYTTALLVQTNLRRLWFGVGIKRYTTSPGRGKAVSRCGLV